jgi:hypothetical protein
VPDALDAALRQLAGHGEHLAALDAREAGHFAQIAERLTQLGDLVTGLSPAARDQSAVLDRLHALDEQVAALAARLTGAGPHTGGVGEEGEGRGYRPSPAPPWWKPHGTGRDEAVTKLAGWVEQVYRPGYGHLAASLGECWDQHPLCLYILDWLSELWSVLYLAPSRTQGTLAGQAEWHARLLTAAAEQLARETRGCRHGTAGHAPAGRNGARP